MGQRINPTESIKYVQLSDKENLLYQNIRDEAKAVLKEKCIGLREILEKNI